MVWETLKNKLHFPEFKTKLRPLISKWHSRHFSARRANFPSTLPRPLRQRRARAAALGSEHLTTAPEGKVWGFAAIRASAPTATPHNEFSLPTAAVHGLCHRQNWALIYGLRAELSWSAHMSDAKRDSFWVFERAEGEIMFIWGNEMD